MLQEALGGLLLNEHSERARETEQIIQDAYDRVETLFRKYSGKYFLKKPSRFTASLTTSRFSISHQLPQRKQVTKAENTPPILKEKKQLKTPLQKEKNELQNNTELYQQEKEKMKQEVKQMEEREANLHLSLPIPKQYYNPPEEVQLSLMATRQRVRTVQRLTREMLTHTAGRAETRTLTARPTASSQAAQERVKKAYEAYRQALEQAAFDAVMVEEDSLRALRLAHSLPPEHTHKLRSTPQKLVGDGRSPKDVFAGVYKEPEEYSAERQLTAAEQQQKRRREKAEKRKERKQKKQDDVRLSNLLRSM